MPMHMGWISPYQALMMQQQQVAMVGSSGQQQEMLATMMGLPLAGKSPKRAKPLAAEQNPDNREHHSAFDVLISWDLKKRGYGWMTTRTASLPIGVPAKSSDADLTSGGP